MVSFTHFLPMLISIPIENGRSKEMFSGGKEIEQWHEMD